MSEYTPGTFDVRDIYTDICVISKRVSYLEACDEFDEWLDYVRAEAWDHGYNAGKNDLRGGKPFKTINPFL